VVMVVLSLRRVSIAAFRRFSLFFFGVTTLTAVPSGSMVHFVCGSVVRVRCCQLRSLRGSCGHYAPLDTIRCVVIVALQ
jgi:hypothetical protein